MYTGRDDEELGLIKKISVAKLKKLLQQLNDTDMLCAQSVGRTGNIGIYREDQDDGWNGMVGIINIGPEELEIFDWVGKQ